MVWWHIDNLKQLHYSDNKPVSSIFGSCKLVLVIKVKGHFFTVGRTKLDLKPSVNSLENES